MDILDNYKEHELHNEYDKDCSECYKENRKLKAWEVVNHKHIREQLGITNESALRGGLFGRGTPWDRNELDR